MKYFNNCGDEDVAPSTGVVIFMLCVMVCMSVGVYLFANKDVDRKAEQEVRLATVVTADQLRFITPCARAAITGINTVTRGQLKTIEDNCAALRKV